MRTSIIFAYDFYNLTMRHRSVNCWEILMKRTDSVSSRSIECNLKWMHIKWLPARDLHTFDIGAKLNGWLITTQRQSHRSILHKANIRKAPSPCFNMSTTRVIMSNLCICMSVALCAHRNQCYASREDIPPTCAKKIEMILEYISPSLKNEKSVADVRFRSIGVVELEMTCDKACSSLGS